MIGLEGKRVWILGIFVGIFLMSFMSAIELTCPEDTEFYAGDSITKDLHVKNIGSQSGFFLFSGQCDNNAELFSFDKNVDPSETEIFKVLIVGGNTNPQPATTQCTIKIQDKVSGFSQSCSFKLTINACLEICDPKNSFCKDGNVALCMSNGCASELIKTCGENEYCALAGTSYDCIDKGKDYTKTIVISFGIIFLLAIVALIGFLISEIKPKRKRR